jgi:hypothetical protein
MGNTIFHSARRHPTGQNTGISMLDLARRHTPMCLSLTALLSILLIAPVSEAKIYKWVDGNGVTHYSQRRPPEVFTTEEIKIQARTAGVATKAKEYLQIRIDALDQRRSNKKLEKEGGSEAVSYQKQLDEYCASVKTRLADYQSDRRLAEKQSDGTYLPVNDKARIEEIGKMQAQIKDRCS